MKIHLWAIIIIVFLFIILMQLSHINSRFDQLEEVIVGANQTVVTEIYRFKEE